MVVSLFLIHWINGNDRVDRFSESKLMKQIIIIMGMRLSCSNKFTDKILAYRRRFFYLFVNIIRLNRHIYVLLQVCWLLIQEMMYLQASEFVCMWPTGRMEGWMRDMAWSRQCQDFPLNLMLKFFRCHCLCIIPLMYMGRGAATKCCAIFWTLIRSFSTSLYFLRAIQMFISYMTISIFELCV